METNCRREKLLYCCCSTAGQLFRFSSIRFAALNLHHRRWQCQAFYCNIRSMQECVYMYKKRSNCSSIIISHAKNNLAGRSASPAWGHTGIAAHLCCYKILNLCIYFFLSTTANVLLLLLLLVFHLFFHFHTHSKCYRKRRSPNARSCMCVCVCPARVE